MITLYHLPISFNSRRVWVALLEKNLDFTLVDMKLDGDQFTPEFLALNPFHHIPVLVDGEVTLLESLAILDYLEAQYPEKPLQPNSPAALGKVKMLELITVNELAPNLSPLIRHNFGIVQATEQVLQQAQEKINTVLTYLEKELGSQTYFCGEQLTLAEVVLGTITPILPSIGVCLTPYPQLARWTKSLLERESWQKTQATPEQIESFQTSMKKLLTPQN